jgi:hypothetical protein
MVPLLPTKFHEILFNSFRGVALTNCDGQEIHGQLKIGGEEKRVLLDWRENGNRRRRCQEKHVFTSRI